MYVTLSRWTAQDEKRLQAAISSRDFWQASLQASISATSCREGERSRIERRNLIAREEKTIAALLARKNAAKEAA